MMTSSDDCSANLLMSSPKARWSKSGVTNMGFICDNDDDFPSLKTPSDSGFDDVMSLVTSPNVEEPIELYHSAVNRRKSYGEVTAGICAKLDLEAPPNGTRVPIQEVQAMAPKIHNRSDGQVFNDYFDVDATEDSGVSLVTSTTCDVIKFQTKRSRSSSVMETKTQRRFSTKPRSFSQPLLKTLAFRCYSTLDEEDTAIDERSISGPVTRGSQCATTTPSVRATAGKVTIYPGYQNDSGISHNDWQVKLNDKEPKLSNEEPERCLHNKKRPALITPTPLPATTSSSSEASYVIGCQVSVGDSTPMTQEPKVQSEVDGIEAEIGSSTRMSETIDSPPFSASTSVSYTSTGQGETVSSLDVQRANGRRRKSLRAIFRLGFLTTKNNKKKNKADGNTSPETPAPDAGPQPPPSGSRITQRRMSRLEMNEPIEDIFSEVKFETMHKRASTSTTDATIGDYDGSDDDDIIEDPEVILKSIIDSRTSVDDVNDSLFFHHDITKLACSEIRDVIDSQSPEKQLLLPEQDRNGQLTTVGEEHPKSSEDGFR